MATNNDIIQYYGRSSQTVHRNNSMATVTDDEVPNNAHYFEDLQHPNSMENWRKQFYSLNIPSDMARSFAPGVMVSSKRVHRDESFVTKVSGPASLRDLPSPKSLCKNKRSSMKRKLENNRFPFSAVVSHLRDIRAKQTKFEWVPQLDTNCINRRLRFETSVPQELTNESEDPIATTSFISFDGQSFKNNEMEQIMDLADSEISMEDGENFTFSPMLTFEHYNKQREFESGHANALFKFAEE